MDYYKKRLTSQFRALRLLLIKLNLILTGKQKKTYSLSLGFMFFNSLLELITLGLLIPFLGVIISPHLLTQFSLGQRFLEYFGSLSLHHSVLILGIIIFTFFVAKNIISYIFYAYYNRFVYSVATELSKKKLDQFYAQSYPDFQKSNTAEMLREISSLPIEFAHHILLGSMVILSEAMIVIMFAAGMAVFQFRIFMMVLCTLLPFVLIAWYISVRFLHVTKKTIQHKSPVILHRLSDALAGFQEAKLYKKEDYFVERYIGGQHDLNFQYGKLNAANIIPGRLSEVFAVAGMMLLLLFSYGIQGDLSPSIIYILTIFAACAYRVIPSMNKILNACVHFQTYSFTVEMMPASLDTAEISSLSCTPQMNSALQFNREIELRHIAYSYPGRKTRILDNVSFCIGKSEMIGLVGRTGSGKTSLVRVLLQLLEQNSGSILVDGKVLQQEDIPSWQNLFAYIAQDAVVLSDTIEANVAFGTPCDLIDTLKVRTALQQAGLSGFIDQLPEGIGTIVGERGKNVSGGQKQRLIIARALYRNAEIFIFDEAMSELDWTSEKEVLETISSLHREGKTILIISHHQRTLTHCRKIYSLRQGNVHEVAQPHTAGIRGN
jgi:ABC-type multidrug transport system fused ATPase/permease subunit